MVRNSAVKKVTDVTSSAPTGLNAARKPWASTVPSNPPEGSAPRTSGKCSSTIPAENDESTIADPINFATGASSNWLRNHRIATRNIATGNKNALNPQNWKKRSEMCAPTGPIQFRAGPDAGARAATLKEASCGE